VKRFVLWDVIIDLGLFTIIGTSFAKYPKAFSVFNGFKQEADKSSWRPFLRVIRNCILTSFVLILLFGIIQGFLFWLPHNAVGIYLTLYHPDIDLVRHYHPQIAYDYFGLGLKLINFSLVFVFLFRIGIIIKIIQELLRSNNRSKPVNSLLIFIALIPFIFCAARFSQPRQYQKESLSDSTISKSLDKQDDEDVLELKRIEDDEPKILSEAPRAHITIHDSSTGETTTND
jgi:hypothetical protein